MKIKYSIFSLVLLVLTTLYSCKKYLDINQDPNNPSQVTEQLMLPAILSTFSYEVAGGSPTRFASFWTKHLAYATAGPHEGNYYLTANDVDNFWRYSSYTSIMGTSVELVNKADKNGNPSYSAIAKIILAWNLSYLTDCYGSIPYSDAFKAQLGITKPKYDSQEDIYKQIQVLLDQAIVDAGKGTGAKPGSDDFIYGGKMSSWIHLANTLKARFYLRLSNAPGYSAATQAGLALTALNAGSITADEAPFFKYLAQTGGENPWYQYAVDGKWSTSPRPSQYYVNLLKGSSTVVGSSDPRLAFQVDPVAAGANAGQYIGVTNDAPPTNLTNYSAIGAFYAARDSRLYLVHYSEALFIRAEAEFLKSNKTVNTAVVNAYNDGLAASMTLYGIKVDAANSTAETKAYLALPEHVVNLTTTSAEAYRKIMTQKYIANYLQFEAYNDFRRTGYPSLPINNEVYPSVAIKVQPVINIIPLRLPYPSSERSYNAANIPTDIPLSPSAAMQIPLWWDK